jgi:hypothetical protein
MANQVQFRRGTTTQNNAFTGAAGEITYDTDAKTLRLHDGLTAGGGATVMTTGATQTVLNKTLSTGSAWQGTPVALAYGGTGAALTAAPGAVPYSTASGMGLSLAGTSGQILVSGGTGSPTWVSGSTLTVGTATVATSATNIQGGSAGQLMIQADTNLTTFITAGAVGTFLQSAGAGYAPTWAAGQVTYGNTVVSLGSSSSGIWGLSNVNISGTTVSTSNFDGALVVAGGVGINGNLNLGVHNQSVHHIQGNVLIATGAATHSAADSALTINLNDSEPVQSNAVVHVTGVSGKSTFYSADAFGAGIAAGFVARRARGTSASPTAVDTNDTIAAFTGRGYGTTGFQSPALSSLMPGLIILADGTFTDTSNPTKIVLNNTQPNSVSSTPAMVIGSNTIVTMTGTQTSTTATTGALVLYGGIGVAKDSFFGANVTIIGNLSVTGQSVSIGSSTLSVQDPIINLHSASDLSPLTSNDGQDIGLKFHYYDTQDSAAFFGRANDTGFVEYYARGTDTSNVFTGTAYGTIKTGEFVAANSTTSTSTTTGALRVTGGVGVGGNVFVAGNIVSTSTGYTQVSTGTTAQRPGSPALGMIRYNSTISSYEGYGAGSTWSSLGGVKSVDAKAYIQAETSAGAGDDVIRVYTGDSGTSTQVMWASSSNVSILTAANVKFPNSTTSTFPASANVDLKTNGGTETTLGSTTDAFGVPTDTFVKYDLMDPKGSIVTYDFGIL